MSLSYTQALGLSMILYIQKMENVDSRGVAYVKLYTAIDRKMDIV